MIGIDIKMPESCHKCRFKAADYCCLAVIMETTPDKLKPGENKPEWCPAIDLNMKTRINLNDTIRVKLTDYGKEIYFHQFDGLIKKHPDIGIEQSYPLVDENGYTEFTFWGFMSLYGEYMNIGTPNVIMPIEIEYEEEKRYSRGRE